MKEKIINYVFNISNQPVLFHQLLQANKLYNDGLHLDGKKLGFRLKMGRAYIVFFVLIHLFIIPASLILHGLFAKLDCHASIVLTVIFTAVVFICFGLFKEWLEDEVARRRIREAWSIHFPLFTHKEYSKKVSEIYDEALLLDVQKKDLEQFVLDKLID